MAKLNSDLLLSPTMTVASTNNQDELQEEEESNDGQMVNLLNAQVPGHQLEEDVEQQIQDQLRQDETDIEIEEAFPNFQRWPTSGGGSESKTPTNTNINSVSTTNKKRRLGAPKARPGDLSKSKKKQPPLRKDTYVVSDIEDEDASSFVKEPKKSPKRSKVLKMNEARPLIADDPEVAFHSIDPILMAPSPQKPPPLPQPPPRSRSRAVTSSKFRKYSEIQTTIPAAVELADCVKAFDEMIFTLNRVGCKYTKETEGWARVRTVEEVKAVQGNRVERRLRALVTAYDALGVSIDEGGDTEDAQNKVTDIVVSLKIECNQILTARLGRPDKGYDYFDDESTERILTDLYFVLFPKFVKAIKSGVEVYNDYCSMGYNALCEFVEMLDLLYELVNTALDQPKSSQPDNVGAYQTVKPIQGILPTLREVRSKFRDEVKNHRKRQEQAEKAESRKKDTGRQRLRAVEEDRREAERLARMKRASQEQNRSRIREDEEAEARRSRLVAERIRLQREDLDRAFADPVYGPRKQHLYEQAMGRYPKKRGSQARVSAETNGPCSQRRNYDMEDDMEDDTFPEDDFERVSVFGKNNTRKDQGQKELSAADKQTFVDIISTERGEDRYEIAANKLNQSIEEIFQLAKDLQEAMDIEHENGRMDSPEDEWTYYIWVDKQ